MLIEMCSRLLSFPFFDIEISSSLWTRRQQKIAMMLTLDLRARHEEYAERLEAIRNSEAALEIKRRSMNIGAGMDGLQLQAEALRELRGHNDELQRMMFQAPLDGGDDDKKAA